jgi:hypothetical protein
MNQKQINFLTMVSAILTFLDNNIAKWNQNAAVTSNITTLRNIKSAIDAKALAQQNDTKGYTAKKNSDMEKMVTVASKLAVRVKNYAVSINDHVLKQAVDFSVKDLESGPEKETVNRCRQIADKAQRW